MFSTKKLKLNTYIGLGYQILVVLSGLIIPRFVLTYFNSEVNGLISSVNQFLSIITFLELGIGSVVQAALYKPIAEKKINKINDILSESESFFNKIGYIFIFYIIILVLMFPIITESPYGYFGTGFLIFALSLRLMSEYFLGISLKLFLNGDQLNYVNFGVSGAVVILNTVVTIGTIILGFPIQIVKLLSGIVFLLKPLILYIYVKKKYSFINLRTDYKGSSIPQKWNGMANQISYTITNSTDIVVLTLLSSLESVSVYTVHNLVVTGIKTFIRSIVGGLQSFFGALIANDKMKELESYFSTVEWGFHTLVTFVFGMTAVLINSFVLIYTTGVNDANYNVPIFAFLLTLSQAVYCIRLPYNELVKSAGHFKQTQNASMIEALLNIVLSIILVFNFGLTGVAIGTLIAISYRLLFLVDYLSKFITKRPIKFFVKQLLVDSLCFAFISVLHSIIGVNPTSIINWILYAIVLSIIYLVFMLVVNMIFYKDYVKRILKNKRLF